MKCTTCRHKNTYACQFFNNPDSCNSYEEYEPNSAIGAINNVEPSDNNTVPLFSSSLLTQRTYVSCEKCGRATEVDTSVVYASNPPCYKYVCEHCGHVGYTRSLSFNFSDKFYTQPKETKEDVRPSDIPYDEHMKVVHENEQLKEIIIKLNKKILELENKKDLL